MASPVDITTKVSALSDKLRAAQKQVRDLEVQKASHEATRKQLLDRLKEEFDVSSLDEATKKLEELKKEMEGYEAQISEIEITLNEIMSHSS